MITLDTDMYLLASRLNLSTAKIEKYGSMSIEEIVEAESVEGNTQAQALLAQIFSDPTELVKVFKLTDSGNKFAILHNLSEHDLNNLLPLLQPEDLAIGLNFFTKDKLLKMVGELPKEQLVKYVSQMFTPEQLMALMPDTSMDKALQSQDLDKGLVLKYLKTLKPEVLSQMIEAATGQPAQGNSKDELINQIGSMPADKYKEALISMPPENKRFFMLQMAKEQPNVLQLFDAESYTKILGRKEKPDLVAAATSIDPQQLTKMVGQLPQDLLSIVCTQIDPQKFAGVLTSDFKNILKQIIAG